MMVVGALIGTFVTLSVGWTFRKVLGPYIAAPIVQHAKAELTDLVAVIVLSPEIQADLRSTVEEVVAHESVVVLGEVRALSGRVERLERAAGDLSRMVRSAIPDRGTDNGGT